MSTGSRSDSDSPQPQDARYTVGYSNEVAEFFGSRRAATHAAFLLQYLVPGMTVLDGGCGPGSITIDLAELVKPGEVTGIDVEQSQVNRARQLAARRGVSNVRFEAASLYELPFPSETFDAILLHGVVEHLNAPLRALQEIKRVLKRGGIVGMRNGDWGGFLFAPRDSQAHRFFELLQALMLQTGGDPHCGRNQLGLLRAAGFGRAVVSASYDCWTRTPEATRQTADFFAAHARSAEFADPALAGGLVDQDTLEQYAKALSAWGQDPGAFAAEAWGEAVAWKE